MPEPARGTDSAPSRRSVADAGRGRRLVLALVAVAALAGLLFLWGFNSDGDDDPAVPEGPGLLDDLGDVAPTGPTTPTVPNPEPAPFPTPPEDELRRHVQGNPQCERATALPLGATVGIRCLSPAGVYDSAWLFKFDGPASHKADYRARVLESGVPYDLGDPSETACKQGRDEFPWFFQNRPRNILGRALCYKDRQGAAWIVFTVDSQNVSYVVTKADGNSEILYNTWLFSDTFVV
jgi:hypothetical protein